LPERDTPTAPPFLCQSPISGVNDLFDELGRHGPLTAAAPADRLGADAVEMLDAHRELARHGLVIGTGETWTTAGKGIFFEMPDEPEAAAAAHALSNVMLGRYADLQRRWIEPDEPRQELDWARAAGMLNAGFAATADELRAIQNQLEQILAPYAGRHNKDAPANARKVRALSFFLPSAS
jgi:hypothetical protein